MMEIQSLDYIQYNYNCNFTNKWMDNYKTFYNSNLCLFELRCNASNKFIYGMVSLVWLIKTCKYTQAQTTNTNTYMIMHWLCRMLYIVSLTSWLFIWYNFTINYILLNCLGYISKSINKSSYWINTATSLRSLALSFCLHGIKL